MRILRHVNDPNGREAKIELRAGTGDQPYSGAPPQLFLDITTTDPPREIAVRLAVTRGVVFGDAVPLAEQLSRALEAVICPAFFQSIDLQKLQAEVAKLKRSTKVENVERLQTEVLELKTKVSTLEASIAEHEGNAAKVLSNFDALLAPIRASSS